MNKVFDQKLEYFLDKSVIEAKKKTIDCIDIAENELAYCFYKYFKNTNPPPCIYATTASRRLILKVTAWADLSNP